MSEPLDNCMTGPVYDRILTKLMSLLIFLVAFCSNASADLGIGQYWQSESPSTIYPTYFAAKNALLATDADTALLELQKSNEMANLNEVSDYYSVPPVPPDLGVIRYLEYYTQQEYATETALVNYFLGQHPSDPECSSTTVDSISSWTIDKLFLGIPVKEYATLTTTAHLYNEYYEMCFDNVNTDGMIRFRDADCPTLYTANVPAQMCTNDRYGRVYQRPVQLANCEEGNPCEVANGDKIIRETDYSGHGLEFKRTYHSVLTNALSDSGQGWSHSYTSRISTIAPYGKLLLVTDSGHQEVLALTYGCCAYLSQSNSGLGLWKITSNEYWLFSEDGSIRYFDGAGQLLKHRAYNGQETIVTHDSQGRVDYVTGPFGHVLDYVYDSNGLLDKVVDPAGNDIEFQYTNSATTAQPLLQKVTYPDSTIKEYLYELTGEINESKVTGIKDENGDRFSTYGYNTDGLVTSSEHAGGQEKITLSYTSSTTQVVENGGSTINYAFSTDVNAPRKALTRTEAGSTKTFTYPAYYADVRNRPTEITDELGQRADVHVQLHSQDIRNHSGRHIIGAHHKL